MMYCKKCGNQIQEGVKFCQRCGERVAEEESITTQRVVQYEGVVKKCPSCGKPLNSNELICSACGWEKRNSELSTTILFKKIENIENNFDLDSNEKIRMITSIVRSFSIPNTIEDLYNFLDEAKVNKNIKLYGDYVSENEKELAQAWEIKYDQAYRKAERLAGDRHDFARYKRERENEMSKAENPYAVTVDKYEENADPKNYKKGKLRKFLIAALVISCFFIIATFATNHIISGIMAVLMAVSTLISLLMIKGTIKVQKKVLCYIPMGLAAIFFIVLVFMINKVGV